MGNCPKCGAPIEEGYRKCLYCRADLDLVTVKPVENNISDQMFNEEPVKLKINDEIFEDIKDERKKTKRNLFGMVFLFFALIVLAFTVCYKFNIFGTTPVRKTTIKSFSTNTVSYNYKEITLNIPANLKVEQDDDGVYINDEDETWIAEVMYFRDDYEYLKNNIDNINNYLSIQDSVLENVEINEYGNYEFITFETKIDETNAVGGYMRPTLNNDIIICVIVYSVDNKYDYDLFSDIAKFIGKTSVPQNIDLEEGNQ